jgi:medium-chain acyl-[acyl-carrier-protein] hydrolase
MEEQPFTEMNALVTDLAEAIGRKMDRPFTIFGHSMGALIGFEVARRLRREFSRVPLRIFVSGYRAPHLPLVEPILHHLPADEFSRRIRQLQDVPTEAVWNDEYMNLMIPTLRADLKLCETYEYHAEPPMECPITAFGGVNDKRVKESDLAAWAEHSSGAFTLRMFQGGHLFLNDNEPEVSQSIVSDLSCQLAGK